MSNSVQVNPVQVNPVQVNPVQVNPVQVNQIQDHNTIIENLFRNHNYAILNKKTLAIKLVNNKDKKEITKLYNTKSKLLIKLEKKFNKYKNSSKKTQEEKILKYKINYNLDSNTLNIF